ncbi:hypothetical protein N781_16970 [Pontibacillus halophilus JSM 076056 = DSM 19796]|uniref:Uncharacterized protein n=1 Tax=Pontibacillus halophilus JSM 076056 = DSM 19796 TaxID=1385510 RepID=A0A0A5GKP3_9BACI|nr:hypothetical protein [Pontibacillus halophilus]KGX92514.1 hypothetical protein N781_16970 [Pontibacillus halophilus JSM 076056 = DSM 19796]
MAISVHYGTQLIGKVEPSSLGTFLLLCKEYGFDHEWHVGKNTFTITPALQGQVLNFAYNSEFADYEKELAKQICTYVTDSGLECTYNKGKSISRTLLIRLGQPSTNRFIQSPVVTFHHYHSPNDVPLKSFIQRELNHYGITCDFQSHKVSQKSSTSLSIDFDFPEEDKEYDLDSFTALFALVIGTALIEYYSECNNKPISACSIHTLTPYLIPKEKETESSAPKGEVKPALEPLTKVEENLNAEVFLDYTVYVKEEQQLQFITDVLIKNTGTAPLSNPMICLKVHPNEGVSITGQILPPSALETNGVTSGSGLKGWRYLEEDWYEKAKVRGEYWVAPIEALTVPPGGMVTLPNVQLKPTSLYEDKKLTVEAIVYFHDENLSFPSNNLIHVKQA